MQAVVIREFGAPEVLRTETVDEPVAGPGWVTVRLVASALNWHDVLVRQGAYHSPLPHVIGADGAGHRTDTGEEVILNPALFWGADQAAPGTEFRILGDRDRGTYAELVSVPLECVVPKPKALSWEEAAALPLVGLTAFRALFARGRLREGERLLVLGAGGGVATMAVSLAVAVGAIVTVTSSSTDKIDRARELGAEGGVLYAANDWVDQARSRTPRGVGFDMVLDAVGDWATSVRALRPGGRLVVLGASRAERTDLAIRPFYFGQFDLLGTTMGSPTDLAGLLRLVDRGAVAPPPISRVFPLDQAAEAHAHLERGAGFGKVVLRIA